MRHAPGLILIGAYATALHIALPEGPPALGVLTGLVVCWALVALRKDAAS